MTEENAQSTTSSATEASARRGGTQFIIKMIFLALIVLAIVFYVRSLDHETPATATTVPSPQTPAAVVAEEPAPATAETITSEPAAPPIAPSAPADEEKVAAPPSEMETAAKEEAEAAEEPDATAAAEATPPLAAQTAEEPRFRPITEEDMLRQIQEVFAPETLEQAPAN